MTIGKDAPKNKGPAGIGPFVQELEQTEPGIISMMLLQDGKEAASFCQYPYRPQGLRLLFSLTKSFTGIGVGIACDRGLLSLKDRVVSFFPGSLPPQVSGNLSRMTVRDLLTMSCGIGENTYAQLFPREDWVKAFLSQDFVHTPGSYYQYSTHASYMLSAVMEAVTGGSFYDFLKRSLLEPLQIYESSWEKSAQGITAGGMGLSVSTESIAKFGQMLLCGGRWNGRQIVSADFVRQATRPQIEKSAVKPGSRSSRYGYQIHIDREDGCFFADGAFGQLCYVAPRHNTVLAVTAQHSDVNRVIDLLWQHVLDRGAPLPPASGQGAAPPDAPKGSRFPVPAPGAVPPDRPVGGTYRLAENPAGLTSLTLQPTGNNLEAVFVYTGRQNSRLHFHFDRASEGTDWFIKDIAYHRQPYTGFATWERDTLCLTVYYTETPYVITYRIRFDGGRIRLGFGINVSFTLSDFTCAGERLPG